MIKSRIIPIFVSIAMAYIGISLFRGYLVFDSLFPSSVNNEPKNTAKASSSEMAVVLQNKTDISSITMSDGTESKVHDSADNLTNKTSVSASNGAQENSKLGQFRNKYEELIRAKEVVFKNENRSAMRSRKTYNNFIIKSVFKRPEDPLWSNLARDILERHVQSYNHTASREVFRIDTIACSDIMCFVRRSPSESPMSLMTFSHSFLKDSIFTQGYTITGTSQYSGIYLFRFSTY